MLERSAVPARTALVQPSDAPLFIASVDVRWRDMDAFGHANNSVYLTYLEEARLQWLQHMAITFTDHSAPVLAASNLQYLRPIEWPATLRIELRCTRLGNSSLTLAHRVIDATDAVYCTGDVVMVWIDPFAGKPVPLPDAVRSAAA
ncbi:MAG TPA: thioesterase family protein [Rhodanobacter sp.]|nr:thioesterase family protein [Rhodanobacter sp.]